MTPLASSTTKQYFSCRISRRVETLRRARQSGRPPPGPSVESQEGLKQPLNEETDHRPLRGYEVESQEGLKPDTDKEHDGMAGMLGRISRRVETRRNALICLATKYAIVESQEGLKHIWILYLAVEVVRYVESQEGLKLFQRVSARTITAASRISRRVETNSI